MFFLRLSSATGLAVVDFLTTDLAAVSAFFAVVLIVFAAVSVVTAAFLVSVATIRVTVVLVDEVAFLTAGFLSFVAKVLLSQIK